MAGTVTVALDSGALFVEDGVLHVGEVAPLAFTGYAPAEGNSIRLTLFDRDGTTPLADNHADAATLDLRGDRLRKVFRGCLGSRVFFAVATEVTSAGASTGEVLATGQVPVAWSPLVFDAQTGEPASLRGPQGPRGEAGASAFEVWKAQDPSRAGLDEAAFIASLRGAPTAMHFVWDEGAQCYRKIGLVEEPETGRLVVEVDETRGYSPAEVTGEYVVCDGEQTITGRKIFTTPPTVPLPSEDNDAVNKGYVRSIVNRAKEYADTVAETARQNAVNDNSLVKKTGDQLIDGIKTFATSPIVPPPTNDYHAANKGYVSAAASSAASAAVAQYANKLSGRLIDVFQLDFDTTTPHEAEKTLITSPNQHCKCVVMYYCTANTQVTVTVAGHTNETSKSGTKAFTCEATADANGVLTIRGSTNNVGAKSVVVLVFNVPEPLPEPQPEPSQPEPEPTPVGE